MLFTWSTENLCIVFRGWRITGTISLIWSLFAIVLMTAGYEFVREMSRRYEAGVQREIENMPRKSSLFCLSLRPTSLRSQFKCHPTPVHKAAWQKRTARHAKVAKRNSAMMIMRRAHLCYGQAAARTSRMLRGGRRSSRLPCMQCRCFIPSSSCESTFFCSCTRQDQIIRSQGSCVYRLLFMTYNGWIMLAVAVGAFVGYLLFGNSSATKSAACH